MSSSPTAGVDGSEELGAREGDDPMTMTMTFVVS